jgi:hypothetical protein
MTIPIRLAATGRRWLRRPQPQLSVVIPTLWAPGEAFVLKLLRRLSRMAEVGEILLIDNRPEAAPRGLGGIAKVRHLPQPQNLFVNPSWNLGVEQARLPLVALCNDDILPPRRLLRLAMAALRDNPALPIGLIGTDKSCFEKCPRQEAKGSSRGRLRTVQQRRYGYGCLMVMRRSCYTPIPDWIRIYGGDDWLFQQQLQQGRLNLAVDQLQIRQRSRRHSLSSGQVRFASQKGSDAADAAAQPAATSALKGPRRLSRPPTVDVSLGFCAAATPTA